MAGMIGKGRGRAKDGVVKGRCVMVGIMGRGREGAKYGVVKG